MATFSSEEAQGKLLSKFHTPLKRKHPEGESHPAQHHPLPRHAPESPKPVPLLPSALEPSYLCQWRVPQSRKHKTWDGDAILIIHGNKTTCSLRSTHDGSMIVTNAPFRKHSVQAGDELYVGGKEIMIERALNDTNVDGSEEKDDQHPVKPVHRPLLSKSSLAARQRTIPASQFYSGNSKSSSILPSQIDKHLPLRNMQDPHPRYNPNDPDAVVMKRPSPKHQELFGRGLPVVDVVLDPSLTRILRPHQIEGVKFMYEAVTGITSVEAGHETPGQGAILADEMGLGKTLQTIALITTLLRQNCYFSSVTTGTVEKVLIVCPLTLVVNWKREFRKWMGRSSIGVLAVEGDGRSEVERFVTGRQYQVLILGYERLRNCAKELAKSVPPIGLIVCDEGHRLKSKDTKTTKCFDLLQTNRRLLLTGTPIQNDLREFYTMMDFVYPGLFDQYSVFKRVFEDPIMRSRVQYCSDQALQLGRARSKALSMITKGIILRRTADILQSYLPPKYEMVVFCTMTPLQRRIYGMCSEFVNYELTFGMSRSHLPYITLLRQLCNSTELLRSDISESGRTPDTNVKALAQASRDILDHFHTTGGSMILQSSGKLAVLRHLLKSIYETTNDRVILVSNFTTTLDVLQKYCINQKFVTLRLDGRTKADDRVKLVGQFNRMSEHRNETDPFVFLLSSKSGGVGLNLIGANRLILFDSDWNPATDRQAMARIHRDGQTKPCYIYRLLLVGTLDEKIYQRQTTKIGLSDSLMNNEAQDSYDPSTDSDSFSEKELKDIFNFHPDSLCLTHDLLGCTCNGSGTDPSQLLCTSDDVEDTLQLTSRQPRGFISAAQLSDETEYEKAQRKKLAMQLGSFLHYNFTTYARTFHFDEALQRAYSLEEAQAGSQIMPSKSASDTVFFEKSPTQDEDFLKHLSRKYMASTPLSSAGGLISYVFVKPPPKIQSISKNPSDTVDFSVAVTDTSPSS